MNRNKAYISVTVAMFLIGSLLSACGSSQAADLYVYSGRTQDLVGPLLEKFEKESGLDVEVKYGSSTDLALTIDTEEDRSPADVFFSQTPGAIGYLSSRDRLQPMNSELLNRVDSKYRDGEGKWVGITGRIRVLAYNPNEVKADELPISVFDLTKDAYKGRIAVAPTNASFQDFITAMRESVGDDKTLSWMKEMKNNDAKTYANNSDIVQAIARGEIDMGLVNHYYAHRLKAEDSKASVENYIFPNADLGSLLVSADAGIVKGSKHNEAANKFIQFLLEEEAQRYFADETFEYPLAAGVQPSVNLPPLSDIATPNIDLDSLGVDLKRTEQLINESGIRG